MKILSLDREWINQNGKTPKAQEIMSTQLSSFFMQYQGRNNKKYGEIFLTDVNGANVAMTKTLSDYYQADEAWWKGAYNEGKGGTFIDDRGFDESVGAIVAGVVAPIIDDGEFLGILKINYKVTHVFDVVVDDHHKKGVEVLLFRSGGDPIVSSKPTEVHTVSAQKRRDLSQNLSGWRLDNDQGTKTVFGYSPIDASIYTRMLPAGAIKGAIGEEWHKATWYTLMEVEQDIAFSSVMELTKFYLLGGGLIILLVTLATWFLAGNISRPIRRLQEGAHVFASGNLSHRLSVDRKDELGNLATAFNTMAEKLHDIISSQRNLSRAVEQSSNMIMITDVSGQIEYANPRFLDFMGYKLEEIVGKNPQMFRSGETPIATYKDIWETILSGNDWSGEIKNKHQDGSTVWLNMSISPVKDEKGALTNFIAIHEDLTARKKSELILIQTQKMESMGSLAGGMAHDINNMLIPIMNTTSLVIATLPKERPERNQLGLVQKAAEQIKSLVDKILAFSRQEPAHYENLDLRDVIRESLALINLTVSSTISVKLELDCGACMVNVDRSQILSVLINLTSNSFDAMQGKTGELKISLSMVKINTEYAKKIAFLKVGHYARLSVTDTGTGMDDATLQRVYDPFFTTKGIGAGTGMGAAMVYGIVLNHDGSVDIQSVLGEGTIVDVYLPLVGEETKR